MVNLDHIKQEMLTQNKRATAWPIFIVVEDRKIYGMDSNYRDCGKERKDLDFIATEDLCDKCEKIYLKTGELPEECENYNCEDSFVSYVIEKDVPNMRAGFFFTAKACDEHIASQKHHYDESAVSYCISAYCNDELREVIASIVGEENISKIT